jgi:hypothetical protein
MPSWGIASVRMVTSQPETLRPRRRREPPKARESLRTGTVVAYFDTVILVRAPAVPQA